MQSNKKARLVSGFIITTFVSLYLIVSVISTIHVIEFFELSNPKWLAISLAIAFEVGAAASLASLIALDKMNKFLVWVLFLILTAMQAMGNTYYAYSHLHDFQSWIELFGLNEEELIYQKRVLSIISGAILPLVALGFIKSLVDYIRPSEDNAEEIKEVLEEQKKDELVQEGKETDEMVHNRETVEESLEPQIVETEENKIEDSTELAEGEVKVEVDPEPETYVGELNSNEFQFDPNESVSEAATKESFIVSEPGERRIDAGNSTVDQEEIISPINKGRNGYSTIKSPDIDPTKLI